MEANTFFIGLDLGQRQDFTAVAVVERTVARGEWDGAMLAHRRVAQVALRHLERLPLGTPYPEVVERVRELTRNPQLAGRCQLAVDATGVGAPVVDMLRQAGLGCRMRPVVITGANLETMERGHHMVPKRDLIIGLQVLLQKRELRIAARLKGVEALVKEMAEMQVKVTASGREQYGAWREGQHDDMILAVALACWGVKKQYPRPLSGEEAYCGR